ncbi:hypothetical protein N5D13_00345 [Stenotrophomonas maltophilia]|uniref:hypothetical protein n=1 Tax=Stenotrophomonas maltophilia TaxID=40324 RepID=UPI00244D296A|nr:hypothetical protein [Stenotrophomonas maltophilia]MDH0071438.1 hypothetical protein [Stenotrophomonas maltophilia]MDH0104260.1 hypothetical protein [Stenotrophomonas maltophilia]MDH0330051.1 hypothetical protein [Stenotrophomonas maltophilia]MDH0631678.1 hypothetical protein [Stenotrophomonas maltophilia]MDH0641063.1 hypothetical protein [Stenotrophomonas maltophilia]
MELKNTLRRVGASVPAKVSAGVAALMASGAALASGGSGSPGAAIAGELSGGKADVMLVVAAAAVILGAIILWGYVKKAR